MEGEEGGNGLQNPSQDNGLEFLRVYVQRGWSLGRGQYKLCTRY